MATLFRPHNRPSFYHRAIIPRGLRPLFRGRAQLWRSLSTNDRDDATLMALAWKIRAQRLFQILKRQGAHMTPAEIEALITRWMDTELDKSENLRAVHPVSDEWLEGASAVWLDESQELNAALRDCNYRTVAPEADALLQAAGLPRLDHDSISFKRLCHRLLRAKIARLSIEEERWNGVYEPRPSVLSSPAVISAPVKKSPLFSIVAKKYLAENQRARRTAEQVRVEFEKFQKAIGGDRPVASITKEEGRAYKEHLLNDRGVSLATVAKHLHTLSGLFTWAEKQGYTAEGAPNPTKGLAPTKTEQEKGATVIRPFTDEELVRVFSSPNFFKQG